MSDSKVIRLSDHFTYGRLYKFVLPSVIMMICTSVYGVIDGLFISNFIGYTPFSAINIIWPFIMIIGGTGFMIGTGGSALVAKTLGEGDEDKANRYFTMLVMFTVILGVILTAVGLVFTRPIARLLGADIDMIDHAVVYGRTVIAFIPTFMLQNVFQSFLATAGKPRIGLIVTVIAGVTNAFFDFLFIVVCKFGLVGAGIATGMGQIVGGVIPLIYFWRKNDSLLQLKKTKIEVSPLLKACANGSSELLTNVASSIVGILYNLQLMKYIGKNGVSAYGVLMYVQLIFLAIEIGFSIGSAPVVSYHYGAGNKDELKSLYKKSMISMSVSGVVLSALAQALAVPLSMLFVGQDKTLFDLTVYAFRRFSFSFIFTGLTIYASGFFTALNNGLVSAILSFARSLVFQVGFVLLMPILCGVDGIWWASFATEVCALIVSLAFFIAEKKRYGY